MQFHRLCLKNILSYDEETIHHPFFMAKYLGTYIIYEVEQKILIATIDLHLYIFLFFINNRKLKIIIIHVS